MKKAWIAVFALLFVWASASAQTPSQARLRSEVLAQILAHPGAAGSCAPQPSGVRLAVAGQEKALCSATATCQSGTVSCSSNTSATSCSAVDRNCANGERGHVTCNGVTTWCPTACACSQISDAVAQQCCFCEQTGDCFSCYACANYGTFPPPWMCE